jgi:hypothetical protein
MLRLDAIRLSTHIFLDQIPNCDADGSSRGMLQDRRNQSSAAFEGDLKLIFQLISDTFDLKRQFELLLSVY